MFNRLVSRCPLLRVFRGESLMGQGRKKRKGTTKRSVEKEFIAFGDYNLGKRDLHNLFGRSLEGAPACRTCLL